MELIEGPRVIRPSSLTTYADCPRRWAARHQPAMIVLAGYSLIKLGQTHCGAIIGSAVHAGAAFTLSEKMRTGGDLGSGTEAEDRAIEEMKDRARDGVTFDATTADISTAQKQVARMTKAFRRHLAPQLSPLQVEERLVGDVGDGWQVSGQVDLLEGDPDQGVGDLKTGTQRRANGLQYGTYAMIWRAHGYQVTRLREHFLARVRLTAEQPAPIMIEIAADEAMQDAWETIESLKRDVAEFERRAEHGGRPPHTAFRANPASQLCGAKWCAAHGTDFCKAHRQ